MRILRLYQPGCSGSSHGPTTTRRSSPARSIEAPIHPARRAVGPSAVLACTREASIESPSMNSARATVAQYVVRDDEIIGHLPTGRRSAIGA